MEISQRPATPYTPCVVRTPHVVYGGGMTTTLTRIGDPKVAARIAEYFFCDDPLLDGCDDPLPPGFEQLDSGKYRSVYLDCDYQTVYKVGHTPSNLREHRKLTEAREAGAAWAPRTELFEIEVGDRTRTVIAMPYLPDEGTQTPTGIAITDLLAVAGDFNMANLHVNGGQLWLIDAGGMW